MSPDLARLAPLLDFPVPNNVKELERLIGMFVYYSKWIPKFADIADPLFHARANNIFPLNDDCLTSMQILKSHIAKARLSTPIPEKLLIVETDASIKSIGAVLSQGGQPVSFFSHKLNNVGKNWTSIELEAYAVVQALSKFRQFLPGRKFKIITDQQGVSFLFDQKSRNKIQNSKLNRGGE